MNRHGRDARDGDGDAPQMKARAAKTSAAGLHVALVVVLVGSTTACGSHGPRSAVTTVIAKCHPAHILYPHEQNEPAGTAGVVWQDAQQVAQNDSQGWVAQLRKTSTGYVIVNCKGSEEGHG